MFRCLLLIALACLLLTACGSDEPNNTDAPVSSSPDSPSPVAETPPMAEPDSRPSPAISPNEPSNPIMPIEPEPRPTNEPPATPGTIPDQATDVPAEETAKASVPAATTPEPPPAIETPTNTETQISRSDALKLARKNGCLACHAIDKKLVGPAWQEVSLRYKDDPAALDRLINKVKQGGKGNWTEITGGAPMPPYSPRVSDENIQTLVSFVLSLSQ